MLAVAGFAAILLSCVLTVHKGRLDGLYEDVTSLVFHSSFIVVPTVAIYILIKRAFMCRAPGERSARVIMYLGELTFGIYLTHVITMKLTGHFTKMLLPLLGPFPVALLTVLATAVLSGAITAVLKRVPPFTKLI
jgi:peptidoglycan/LPS O-acetylase OafA/YrhL